MTRLTLPEESDDLSCSEDVERNEGDSTEHSEEELGMVSVYVDT